MKERRVFYKQLTTAELGEAKTHEKYIRFPNDFDYKSFFGKDAVQNESVLQLNIDAHYNGNPEDIIPLKFVYYVNSNKEKRMPSLGAVFDKYQVKVGNIFALEVISNGENTHINVSFKSANELKLFTTPICYTEMVKDEDKSYADVVIDRKEHKEHSQEELATLLNKMYQQEKAAGVHLFALKYGDEIHKFNNASLISEANIPDTYKTELSKMLKVFKLIKSNTFNICFFEDASILDLTKSIGDLSHLADTSLLTAMRTKPFLLLAGISGTGKSRIVKQMAFESCPNIPVLRCDKTAPGNYELIEVKPNWHDSTELLGYESEIGGSHFVLTPFIKFLVKAMRYEDKAPFFVCMDEMNLAPVEQYFAEFLSVLESRKLLPNGTITSEPLVKADIFTKYEATLKDALFDIKQPKAKYDETEDPVEDYGDFNSVYERLKAEGLRLPSNLIVVGTVNMDETTHQFSRKVIDRAMTIEMNIEDAETPFKNFFDGTAALDYPNGEPADKNLFLPKIVQASEALSQLSDEDATYLKDSVPQLLHTLNTALNGTPFKIAYRVQNELILYFYSQREEKPEDSAETLLATAMDAILMLKVLPRIEGDEDLLEKPLKALAEFTESYQNSAKKIAEMQERLSRAHFTSFWP